ncbi:MAG: hypothetical protein ACPHQ9_10075 [Marinobacter sp.]|uniref:hypothetical protein n=1 Tax=Marinobacter sp. TaxID=50741 RepID=UPI003C3739C9
MAAFFMFRGYLPVVPGVVLIMVLAFIFGLFAVDYTAAFMDIWNDALWFVYQWIERIVLFVGYLFTDGNIFVDRYEVYVDDFKVVGTYSSLNEFDYGNSNYTTYPSQLGLMFEGYFEFFELGSMAIPREVYGMGAYFVGELMLFAFLMISAARNGQHVPDIKQRFGE